jgi:hypothetical protein
MSYEHVNFDYLQEKLTYPHDILPAHDRGGSHMD